MKTRRVSALFVVLAAAASCQTHSEAKPQSKSAETKRDQLPHPLLWSIEKDGKTSFALGTFHLGIDPRKRLPDLVWQKLDAEPAFATETDLSDPSLAKDIMARPDGKTLHDELGDAYWKKLEAALTPDGAKRVNAMRPTIAATMLSMRGLPITEPM